VDATSNDWPALEAARDRFSNVNLRILVNNVAYVPKPMLGPISERSAQDVSHTVDACATFPAQITRIFLPLLQKNQPAAVLTLGSGGSELPSPYLTTYTGAKAFNKVWSRALGCEMRAEGHDIEVLLLQVGMVSSNSTPRATNLWIPSSRRFAQACLGKLGCGLESVWAYWPHAFQFGFFLGMLPSSMLEKRMIPTLRGLMEDEKSGKWQGGEGSVQ
jgi:17beta-estradiol 17-dehydrogenase / very-long-chain 3-oxoacyl-CoA reductase